MKQCTVCLKQKEEKEEKEFSKNKNNPDGLCYRCKQCRHDYYIKHRELNIEQACRYKKKYPEKARITSLKHYYNNIEYYRNYYKRKKQNETTAHSN